MINEINVILNSNANIMTTFVLKDALVGYFDGSRKLVNTRQLKAFIKQIKNIVIIKSTLHKTSEPL